MKIVLLITACKGYTKRIQNQIDNLKNLTSAVEWVPIFLFGKDDRTLDISIPYDILTVDVEEKYNKLYLKLLAAYKDINEKYSFDFICKIDDDTKLNFENFDPTCVEGKDYVGSSFPVRSTMAVRLDFDFYDIHKTINLMEPLFDTDEYPFATGDMYFISKKAVEAIIRSEYILLACKPDAFRTCEDRMFAYVLHKNGFVLNDIKVMNESIIKNKLQVTKNYFSIHPIHEGLFSQLLSKSGEEQIQFISENQTLNLMRRDAYIKEFEKKFIEAINDFINSPKSMGLG